MQLYLASCKYSSSLERYVLLLFAMMQKNEKCFFLVQEVVVEYEFFSQK